ncbi:MAG: type III-B CRISPR module-associated Cmr3 family protein [Cyanobacteriota bacterium]|nr:type III-B CRISPR module-associated Cmr3 family protein [Cyanobacteriota bacterium]
MPTQKIQDQTSKTKPPFKYVVIIEPLGLLYGSAGRFLSPENLVGRSGTSFPPSAATLSGLFAAHYSETEPDTDKLNQKLAPLQLAGPFWAFDGNPKNFMVPTPFNCLVKWDRDGDDEEPLKIKTGRVKHQLVWHSSQKKWLERDNRPPMGKFSRNSWIPIEDWKEIISGDWPKVFGEPWEYSPHLHPQLEKEQRRVDSDRERGSLFLENAVELNPNTCLVYLANEKLPNGWYRFGGEGHMVNLECHPISEPCQRLLTQSLGQSFALITPAIWGSNRLSQREPVLLETDRKAWEWDALLAERPSPYRYRLGGGDRARENPNPQGKHQPRRLSRGRYAMPAGSVYVLKEELQHPTWQDWPDNWFPREYYSFKRWGCGLALPMDAIATPQS